jgi:hypothetical protein
MDAKINARYWNKLPQDALIFDPVPSRSPTILGRPTDSHITWYQEKAEWQQIVDNPTVSNLRAAGFTHIYIDKSNWDLHKEQYQQLISEQCVVSMEKVLPKRGVDFRLLLDISDCPAD